MLKNISQLHHIIAGKAYHFTCDHDCPLEHVKEALFQFITYIGKLEEYIKSQQEAAKNTSTSSENPEKKEDSAESPKTEVDNVHPTNSMGNPT